MKKFFTLLAFFALTQISIAQFTCDVPLQQEWGQLVDCAPTDQPVCGCNGQTYQNPCFAFYYAGQASYSMGACGQGVNCQIIPSMVDFGECAMPLGWMKTENGPCIMKSGCSTVGNNGVDYADFFYEFEYGCNGACDTSIVLNCVDTSLIDPNMGCLALWDPVCGCDGITYANECEATYRGGLLFWSAGECGTIGMVEWTKDMFRLSPNPTNDKAYVDFEQPFAGRAVLSDLSGRTVKQWQLNGLTRLEVDLQAVETGVYVLSLVQANTQFTLRIIRE